MIRSTVLVIGAGRPTAAARPAIETWLAPGAEAWRRALTPLTPAERRTVVDTLLAYEAAAGELRDA